MKFYENDWFIILMLFLYPPAGLILMWMHSKWSNDEKTIVTIVIATIVVTCNIQIGWINFPIF